MVPFLASFVGREDRTLEDRLRPELPGILHKFLMACPDVIANGLREPASVLEHTATYFQERDLAKQFAEDCLNADRQGRALATKVDERIGKWVSEQRSSGVLG